MGPLVLSAILIIATIILLCVAYWARLYKWKHLRFLYQTETPLIVAIFIAIVSITVGPYLNSYFEQQRIKSEYILDNLKNLKLDTLQLFSNIQRLNKDKLNPTYIQIENDGLRLRYRVLEIESILGESQYTKEFQNNLTILLNNLQSSPDKRYIYLSNFVISSRNLSIHLSKVANIADEDIKFYKIEKLEAK